LKTTNLHHAGRVPELKNGALHLKMVGLHVKRRDLHMKILARQKKGAALQMGITNLQP